MEKYLVACVVKIASRCNLNCTYCYMYNKGDDSYKNQPKFLSRQTMNAFFEKMDFYLSDFKKDSFTFVFHGGEPLLAHDDDFLFFIGEAKKVCIKNNVKAVFAMQTNGVLINEERMRFLKENDINIGISLDSTKESNEKFRVYHNNKSSYDDILKGIETHYKVMEYSPAILSVMDINQSPKLMYDHYKEIGINYINLLFPDDTYDSGFNDDLKMGKWLLELFKMWIEDKSLRIEQFEVLLSIFYGAEYVGDEYYGKKLNNTFILETDGELQANDPLRVCVPLLHKTKMNVFSNEITDLFKSPIADLYYNSKNRLCSKCNDCQLSEICSGGYLINRYSKINGFDNPSIFCKSLAYFLTHVQNMIAEYTNPKLDNENERIDVLNLDEIMIYCNSNDYEKNHELSVFKA